MENPSLLEKNVMKNEGKGKNNTQFFFNFGFIDGGVR